MILSDSSSPPIDTLLDPHDKQQKSTIQSYKSPAEFETRASQLKQESINQSTEQLIPAITLMDYPPYADGMEAYGYFESEAARARFGCPGFVNGVRVDQNGKPYKSEPETDKGNSVEEESFKARGVTGDTIRAKFQVFSPEDESSSPPKPKSEQAKLKPGEPDYARQCLDKPLESYPPYADGMEVYGYFESEAARARFGCSGFVNGVRVDQNGKPYM